jgi:putative ABC transport system permease protein
VLALAWKTVRARKGAFVGAFVAVLCGSALVTACGVLMESGIRAGVPVQRFAAAPVVVAGERTVRAEGGDALAIQPVAEEPLLPAELVERIAAAPGVARAVPEITFDTALVTADGRVLTGPAGHPALGHGWGSAVLAPFGLRTGSAPAADDEVVLDAELAGRAGAAAGDSVTVVAGGVPQRFRVTGTAAPAVGDGLSRQSALFFTDDRAAVLSRHPGSVDAIGVVPEEGVQVGSRGLVDRVGELISGVPAQDFVRGVEDAVGGERVTVTTGNDRSVIEFADVGRSRTRLLVIAGSFGGIAALVAIFVVAGTLALSVQQRRREFALLRAVAATPRQIRKMVTAEVLLLSTAAAVVGGVGGIAVAGWLRDAFADAGVVPADFQLALGPLPVLVAVLLVVGAAEIAAVVVARGPARIRPVDALAEAAVRTRGIGVVRTVAGVVLYVAGLVVAAVPLMLPNSLAATALSGLSALVQVVGLALLGPTVVAVATRVLARPLRGLWPVGGYLAAANALANTRRLAAAITPLMLAIGFAVTFFFTQTTLTAAAQEQAEESVRADFVVTAPLGLADALTGEARAVPGVDVVTPIVRTSAIVPRVSDNPRVETVGATGVDPAGLSRTLDVGVESGSFDDLRGATVALSVAEAESAGVSLGDEVDLYYGDGTRASPTLVATFRHNLGLGEVFLPRDQVVAHTTARLDSALLVRAADGADRQEVRQALTAVVGAHPGAVVQERDQFTAAAQRQQETTFLVNLIALGVVLLYIAISVSNTLVMTTGERVREFALMRLVGSTRRQVIRMMRVESAVVVVIAVVVGTLVPVPPLVFLSLAYSGAPFPAGPPLVYLAIVAVAVVLAHLSTAVPTRVALRVPPADAIGLRV